jgi:hypothetical protein
MCVCVVLSAYAQRHIIMMKPKSIPLEIPASVKQYTRSESAYNHTTSALACARTHTYKHTGAQEHQRVADQAQLDDRGIKCRAPWRTRGHELAKNWPAASDT